MGAENNLSMDEGSLEIGMEYRTVSGVAGPLVILDKVRGPKFQEIVNIRLGGVDKSWRLTERRQLFSPIQQRFCCIIPLQLLELYAGLIRLALQLPTKEDNIRHSIARFLLTVPTHFGESYLTPVMLPVFLVAIGDHADLKFVPLHSHLKIRDLKPQTSIAQRLATESILPILLAGGLGHPSQAEHLKSLLSQSSVQNEQLEKHEIVNFNLSLCTFQELQNTMFNLLWEMVASSNASFKIYAADLSKILVSRVEARVASVHVIPALVTLGSDQDLEVKYASINAYGTVAQNFKNDMV